MKDDRSHREILEDHERRIKRLEAAQVPKSDRKHRKPISLREATAQLEAEKQRAQECPKGF